MNAHIHFALVSGQNAPILFPLLDSEAQAHGLPATDLVLLLTPTAREQRQGEALSQSLQDTGLRIHQEDLPDAVNFQALMDTLETVLKKWKAQGTCYLNATTGTKAMSTAAFLAFYNEDQPVYYVNGTRLHWWHTLAPGAPESLELTPRCDLKRYLLAHNRIIEHCASETRSSGERHLVDALKPFMSSAQNAFSALNALAAEAHVRNQSPKPIPASKIDKGPKELPLIVEAFEQHGFMRRQGEHWHFADENARELANGGWIELITEQALADIRKEHPDLDMTPPKRSIVLTTTDGRIRNELDVAFLSRWTLHVVECKTRRFQGEDASKQAEDAIYKLATLTRKLGGLRTQGAFVTYFDIRKTQARQRAEDFGVQIILARNFNTLKSQLVQWLRGEQVTL